MYPLEENSTTLQFDWLWFSINGLCLWQKRSSLMRIRECKDKYLFKILVIEIVRCLNVSFHLTLT